MVDDLNEPLGQDKQKRLPNLPVSAPQVLAGVLGLSGPSTYAQPRQLPPGKKDSPLIAIVVGGLGISHRGCIRQIAGAGYLRPGALRCRS